MKNNYLKSTALATALVVSCMGGLKAYQTYNLGGSSLLMENVEALSDGESGYGHYAERYYTGKGIYVTKINGSISTGVHIALGMRISTELEAELGGSIDTAILDDWMMTCLPEMGCFTVCTPIDWRPGDNKTDHTDDGCPY